MKEAYEAPSVTALGTVYEVTLGMCVGLGDGQSVNGPRTGPAGSICA